MEDLLASLLLFFRRFILETVLITIAIAVAAGAAFLYLEQAENPMATEPVETASGTDRVAGTVTVDVAGAVQNSGVYEIERGSRLKDAVTAAGGLSPNADTGYFIRNFNLARYLADQEKIYIPALEEVAAGLFTERRQVADYLSPREPSSLAAAETAVADIHINTADRSELEKLPGVGEATAQKIIQMRPYATVDELLSKQAVKKNVFEQIKNMISL